MHTHSRSISIRRAERAWRPAAPPSREPVFHCLALKVGWRFDELSFTSSKVFTLITAYSVPSIRHVAIGITPQVKQT